MSTININVSKTDMGLDQVDNTSDLNKPISTATQTALDLKVDKVTDSRLITSAESTLLGNTSGVNSGDETVTTIKSKLGVTTLSGSNTGDETITTIKTKLGITTLSGSNTGDQDLTPYATKATPTFTGLTTLDTLKVTTGNYITPVDVVGIDVLGNVNRVSAVNGRTALGLGSLATQSGTFSGTSSGTNTGDQDLSGLMVKSNNLSDLTNTTTARTNLGLGSLATQSGTFSGTSSGTNTGDQTFLNARVQTVTSSATVTPVSTNDLVIITAQAAGLTLANPTGTFTEGQALMIRIKDNGTARAIAFDTNYRAIGVTLPTTTVISKTLYLGIIYNSTDSKWDVVGYNIQA